MVAWTAASSGAFLAAASLASAATIQLPLKIDNTYPYVEAQIGTPPKVYRLRFDTGSATSFVTNWWCESAGKCPNLTQYKRVGYNPDASSTYKYLGPYNTIPYIDGDQVAGPAVQDEFTLHTEKDGAPITWNQTFMNAEISSWRLTPADGFLGMSFTSIAEPNTTTVVETLLQQGLLDSPRVGIFYGTNGSDGVMTIGGSKEDVYVQGKVQYAPLRLETPYQLWRTALRSVIVTTGIDTGASNKTTIPLRQRRETVIEPKSTTLPVQSGRIVFDTGAGRVSLPSDVITPVYAALGWSLADLLSQRARWTCKDHNATWAVSFVIGEEDPIKDVVYQIQGDELRGDENCMPPFDDSGVVGFGLFGSAFMSRFYSVLDYGGMDVGNFKPRIGFGRLKKEYDSLPRA